MSEGIQEAAKRGDAAEIQRLVEEAAQQTSTSVYEVLTTPFKTKDNIAQTLLNLACQSSSSSLSGGTNNNSQGQASSESNDNKGPYTQEGDPSVKKQSIKDNAKDEESKNDIVFELTLSEWAQKHDLLVPRATAETKNDKNGTTDDKDGGDSSNNINDIFSSYIGAQDQHGLTPLMFSAQHADPSVGLTRVTTLLRAAATLAAKGVNKNDDEVKSTAMKQLASQKSKNGATALHFAVGTSVDDSHRQVIQALYDVAPQMLDVNSLVGGTPLHWASASRHTMTKLFEFLVDGLGANAFIRNAQGLTPMIIAVATQNDTNAAWLAKRSGGIVEEKVSEQTKEGSEANGKVNGAGTKEIDNSTTKVAGRGYILSGSSTIYHMTAKTNMVQTLRELISFDDGKSLEDPENLTAKCCALRNESDNLTPLDMAVHESNIECVRLLLPFTSGDIEAAKSINIQDDDAIQGFISKHKIKVEELRKQSKIKTTDVTNRSSSANGVVPDEVTLFEQAAKQKATNIKTGRTPTPEEIEESLTHKQQGNEAFSSKDYEKAMKRYTKAIECNPMDATFYSNRSACYMQLKQHRHALWDAIICRHLRPEWTKGCYRLAVARLALERYEDAAVAAWEGLEIEDGNDELRSLLQKAVRKGKAAHKKKTIQEMEERETKEKQHKKSGVKLKNR